MEGSRPGGASFGCENLEGRSPILSSRERCCSHPVRSGRGERKADISEGHHRPSSFQGRHAYFSVRRGLIGRGKFPLALPKIQLWLLACNFDPWDVTSKVDGLYFLQQPYYMDTAKFIGVFS